MGPDHSTAVSLLFAVHVFSLGGVQAGPEKIWWNGVSCNPKPEVKNVSP